MKGGFKRIVILACFERRHQRGDRAETKRSRADFSCSSVRRSKSDKVKPNFGRAERIKFNAVLLHISRGRLPQSFSALSYGTDCIASHAYSAKCREEESRLGGRGRRRKGPREKERGYFSPLVARKQHQHYTTPNTRPRRSQSSLIVPGAYILRRGGGCCCCQIYFQGFLLT